MTTVIETIVVDDEPLAAALIRSYVERTPFLHLVGEAHSAEEALELIKDHPVDLMYLDIKMPRITGLELARMIPQSVKVVFTTAYSDHAVEGFRVDALDYLLKPVSYEEFLESAMRAQRDMMPAEESRIQPGGHLLVKSEYRLLRIPFGDIEYIEGLKDYVKIFVAGESKAILSLMSIKSLEDGLPSDKFMRVHRSFIVNIDKVRVVERNCIIMGGRAKPVSDSNRKAFMERIEG